MLLDKQFISVYRFAVAHRALFWSAADVYLCRLAVDRATELGKYRYSGRSSSDSI